MPSRWTDRHISPANGQSHAASLNNVGLHVVQHQPVEDVAGCFGPTVLPEDMWYTLPPRLFARAGVASRWSTESHFEAEPDEDAVGTSSPELGDAPSLPSPQAIFLPKSTTSGDDCKANLLSKCTFVQSHSGTGKISESPRPIPWRPPLLHSRPDSRAEIVSELSSPAAWLLNLPETESLTEEHVPYEIDQLSSPSPPNESMSPDRGLPVNEEQFAWPSLSLAPLPLSPLVSSPCNNSHKYCIDAAPSAAVEEVLTNSAPHHRSYESSFAHRYGGPRLPNVLHSQWTASYARQLPSVAASPSHSPMPQNRHSTRSKSQPPLSRIPRPPSRMEDGRGRKTQPTAFQEPRGIPPRHVSAQDCSPITLRYGQARTRSEDSDGMSSVNAVAQSELAKAGVSSVLQHTVGIRLKQALAEVETNLDQLWTSAAPVGPSIKDVHLLREMLQRQSDTLQRITDAFVNPALIKRLLADVRKRAMNDVVSRGAVTLTFEEFVGTRHVAQTTHLARLKLLKETIRDALYARVQTTSDIPLVAERMDTFLREVMEPQSMCTILIDTGGPEAILAAIERSTPLWRRGLLQACRAFVDDL